MALMANHLAPRINRPVATTDNVGGFKTLILRRPLQKLTLNDMEFLLFGTPEILQYGGSLQIFRSPASVGPNCVSRLLIELVEDAFAACAGF